MFRRPQVTVYYKSRQNWFLFDTFWEEFCNENTKLKRNISVVSYHCTVMLNSSENKDTVVVEILLLTVSNLTGRELKWRQMGYMTRQVAISGGDLIWGVHPWSLLVLSFVSLSSWMTDLRISIMLARSLLGNLATSAISSPFVLSTKGEGRPII